MILRVFFAGLMLLSQNSKPQIQALHISESIRVDGRLNEPAWPQAEPATDFRQREPQEGQPASERTEIRILVDAKNLYIGIRAFDSEPARVNARELTRDADFANDDLINILLDTYGDGRNAFRFAVNPNGVQQDALITDEGQDINVTWDTSWISEGRRDEQGWIVEIAIPLTSLRFREDLPSWGLNFSRIIRRKNEENGWTSWQRNFGLTRVSQAGELTGVEEIKLPRVVQVKPYLSGGWRQQVPRVGESGYDTGMFGAGGLEVAKLGITPGLTAEFTANPDFGQVEVDQQVINFTRFSVNFPEKRDFFLENVGIFSFGESFNRPFYTRRIGLTADGRPLPIDYGAKVTGKVGDWNVGLFQVQTRELGTRSHLLHIPSQQFTVARVKRDILRRSTVGGIFVNRQGGATTSYNRTAGLESILNFTNSWNLQTFWMGTATPGITSGFHSARVDSTYETDRIRVKGVYENVGDNFNPEAGYIQRPGIFQYFSDLQYKPRPRWLPGVRQIQFGSQYEYYETRRHKLFSRRRTLSSMVLLKNSAQFSASVQDLTDAPPQPFRISGVLIPAGSYHHLRPDLSFSSDRSRRFVFNLREQWGKFYSGTRRLSSAGVTLRPNPHILVTVSDEFNRLNLLQRRFSTNLMSGRANLNISRKILTAVFVQLNSSAKMTSLNARVRYIFRPNSDFYVIYNDNTGRGLERPSRQLQFKLTIFVS
jgi:hypothetical protein